MLNKRTLHVIIVILAISNISVVTFMIWNRPPVPSENPKTIIETTLNLSEDQKESFENLIPPHRKSMRVQHEKIFKLKSDLMMTVVDTNLFLKKDQLIKELEMAFGQMEVLRLNHLQEVYNLCSEEQRGSFEELIEKLQAFLPPPVNPKRQRRKPIK